MFWYILAIIVLILLHYFFYFKAYNTRSKVKEVFFMGLTVVITLVICGILFEIFNIV